MNSLIHEERRAHCPKCDEDVNFEIKLCYVDYNGTVPCYKCPGCGVIVPAFSFDSFIQTGKLLIPV